MGVCHSIGLHNGDITDLTVMDISPVRYELSRIKKC